MVCCPGVGVFVLYGLGPGVGITLHFGIWQQLSCGSVTMTHDAAICGKLGHLNI